MHLEQTLFLSLWLIYLVILYVFHSRLAMMDAFYFHPVNLSLCTAVIYCLLQYITSLGCTHRTSSPWLATVRMNFLFDQTNSGTFNTIFNKRKSNRRKYVCVDKRWFIYCQFGAVEWIVTSMETCDCHPDFMQVVNLNRRMYSYCRYEFINQNFTEIEQARCKIKVKIAMIMLTGI